MIVIAHNIRSLHNVGAIFRCADAFDVDRIYLTGYTGTPPRKEIAKVALGSEHRVPWDHYDDILDVIATLQTRDVAVLALETGERATAISTWRTKDADAKTALIVGNEVDGLPRGVLEAADAQVNIPMPGQKKSLNVSVATGIALFALTPKKLVS